MTDESQVTKQPEESVDVDALQADRDQLFDRLQRLAAEFDNFRKRNAREQAAFAERASERPVVDEPSQSIGQGGVIPGGEQKAGPAVRDQLGHTADA